MRCFKFFYIMKRKGTVSENNELFSRIVLFVKGEGEGSEQITDC